MSDMRDQAGDIFATLAETLGPKGLRVSTASSQWMFFSHCLNRALDPDFPSDLDALPRHQATQFKFEVENRLKRFYLSYVRETNTQTYYMHCRSGEWKVYENPRPSPRTSAPNRRLKGR